MKITIITNDKGEIMGTARFPEGESNNAPTFKAVNKPGQKVRQIDLPAHLEKIESAEELHTELKKLIK
jgi:hypothetical protein